MSSTKSACQRSRLVLRAARCPGSQSRLWTAGRGRWPCSGTWPSRKRLAPAKQDNVVPDVAIQGGAVSLPELGVTKESLLCALSQNMLQWETSGRSGTPWSAVTHTCKSRLNVEAQDLCWSLRQLTANALAAYLWPGCSSFSSSCVCPTRGKLSEVRSPMHGTWSAAVQLPQPAGGSSPSCESRPTSWATPSDAQRRISCALASSCHRGAGAHSAAARRACSAPRRGARPGPRPAADRLPAPLQRNR